jgi:hypothetical protein
MEAQVLNALIAFGVPYVTDILKRAYALFSPSAPEWLAKLKPIAAGIALNYLSNKTNMPVPADLVHLTNDPQVNFISTGIVYGTIGHWLSSFADGLKSHIPSTTTVGKALSIFLGKY